MINFSKTSRDLYSFSPDLMSSFSLSVKLSNSGAIALRKMYD